ncbi:Uncharacterised protein [Klebsiella aerogenes]|nr:Uncharacterised protein [Klebsiella aerogenes]
MDLNWYMESNAQSGGIGHFIAHIVVFAMPNAPGH